MFRVNSGSLPCTVFFLCSLLPVQTGPGSVAAFQVVYLSDSFFPRLYGCRVRHDAPRTAEQQRFFAMEYRFGVHFPISKRFFHLVKREVKCFREDTLRGNDLRWTNVNKGKFLLGYDTVQLVCSDLFDQGFCCLLLLGFHDISF